jgi:ABC-type uncharacterized transport system permease subunit
MVKLGPLEAFREGYESALLLAALIGIVGLTTHATASLRGLDGVLFIMAALVQLGSLMVGSDGGEASRQLPWFVSHPVAFAVAGACFVASGAAGMAYLIMNRMLRKRRPTTLFGRVASLEALERFGRWMIMLGFPIFTYGMLTGICGIAHMQDRSKVMQDPLVFLSVLAWLVYALMVLAMWFQPQIRGRRAARLTATGTGLIVIVFVMVMFASPLHQ